MTMIRFLSLSIFCFFFVTFAFFSIAQDSAPAVPENAPNSGVAQTEEEAIALGPKNKAFVDSYTEYREHAKKMTAMKVEYQGATPERQREIESQYDKHFQEGLAIHKKSLDLALDAHEETPNRNPLVVNLLYSTVGVEFNRENYEESVRVFKRLEAAGIDEDAERFYAFAGLSALLSMNYDEAEKWLETAHKSGELTKLFESYGNSKAGRHRIMSLQGQLMLAGETQEAWEKEQAIRKAETEAGEQDPAKKLPRVELITSKGRIVLELFENEAPNAVANFVSLVEKGFYNGVIFHRVLPVFMAQGGDPTGTGSGGPGYNFDCECGRNFPQQRLHFRGSISMAHAGQNTNGSQFFLTFVPTSMLDGRHTVFGRVVEGMEVLADIQRVDPDDKEGIIPERDKIVTAKVLNKRDHAYEVKKNNIRR